MLPALYSHWLGAALPAPLPEEKRATCDACVMCAPPDAGGPVPPSLRFDPRVKCCSYQPLLPNFRVGQILLDSSDELQTGRSRVAERVRHHLAATPLGLGWGPAARQRYDRALHDDGFGRDPAMVCPYFSEEGGGRCTVWAYREAVCSTFFCRHDAGVRGRDVWMRTLEFLQAVEHDLSEHCLIALDIDTAALDELFARPVTPRDPAAGELLGWVDADGRIEEPLRRRIWGRWYGREQSFYEECGRLVARLDWNDVRSLTGPRTEIARRLAAASLEALREPGLPAALCLSAVQSRETVNGFIQLTSPHTPYDPIDVTASVHAALAAFDGRPLEAAVASAHRDHGVRMDEGWLVRLRDHGVLVPADGRDLEPGGQPTGALEPDHQLRFFKGFRSSPVVLETAARENGATVLTVRCGANAIDFDPSDLHGFARGLVVHQNGFRAIDAAGWSDGEPYSWDRVRGLLTALLEGCVLQRWPKSDARPEA